MNIMHINAVPYGSTAKIMFSISDILEAKNHRVLCTTGFTWVGCKRSNWFQTSNLLEKSFHMAMSYITGMNGCFSYFATLRLIHKIGKFSPDLIHLHNLHGWYINLPMLFSYIKQQSIPVIWTLHDCWAFTGQCPHFTMAGCEKWKTGCHHCPQYRLYPQSILDRTKTMYTRKKKWFTGVPNMTIVTPSQWLASLVKQSFLQEYPIKVINNGIDLSIFKSTESDFRDKYSLHGKFIVLGVSFEWGKRKGLDVFIELAAKLDERFQIVLIGTDDKVDELLPNNIISIHRTHNQRELAEIYTAADVFANPTREDNYPTVNMEAIACGTPVITFNTGGSPECIDSSCGVVVECNDNEALMCEILRMCQDKVSYEKTCLKKAMEFDMHIKHKEYLDVYEGVVKSL